MLMSTINRQTSLRDEMPQSAVVPAAVVVVVESTLLASEDGKCTNQHDH